MKVLYMLGFETIRHVCIDNNFYNAGSNEEYENMFSIAAKNGGVMTVEEVAEIAEDIAAHTHMISVEHVAGCLLNAAYIIVR